MIAKPTDTATEIHISRFNALICQDSLQDSFMTAAMSLLPTVCTEEKPKVGTQTEGTPQEVWFGRKRKRRDGQTRKGFPLVRCKKRLFLAIFCCNFLCRKIGFPPLRMQPKQPNTHWMRQIGKCDQFIIVFFL